MTTQKQTCPEPSRRVDANRQNAQKSTGPKSEIGKRKSAQNALKHGLFSNSPVIEDLNEVALEYNQLKILMQIELRPKGILQTHLVQKIVDLLWRYRRVINSEKSAYQNPSNPHNQSAFWTMLDEIRFKHNLKAPDANPADKEAYDMYLRKKQNKQTSANSPLPSGAESQTFGRYESRLDRQLYRTIRLLKSLQRLKSPNHPKRRKK